MASNEQIIRELTSRIADCCGWLDDNDVLNTEQHVCGRCGLDLMALDALRDIVNDEALEEGRTEEQPDVLRVVVNEHSNALASIGAGQPADHPWAKAARAILDAARRPMPSECVICGDPVRQRCERHSFDIRAVARAWVDAYPLDIWTAGTWIGRATLTMQRILSRQPCDTQADDPVAELENLRKLHTQEMARIQIAARGGDVFTDGVVTSQALDAVRNLRLQYDLQWTNKYPHAIAGEPDDVAQALFEGADPRTGMPGWDPDDDPMTCDSDLADMGPEGMAWWRQMIVDCVTGMEPHVEQEDVVAFAVILKDGARLTQLK
jgi:hypothetical protein